MTDAPMDPALVSRTAELLAGAQRVLFITGAGISADSGLPTYRGIGGLYDGKTPEAGLPIEEILSGSMLQRDPALCWKYIAQIEQACRGATPNAGHRILADLEARLPHACVLTQNVDGFHGAAGSRNVIAIHGDVHDLRCTGCAHRDRVNDYAHLEIPPRCPHCDAVVRPGVVLFGEALPSQEVTRLEAELATGFDLVCSVGTSSLFPYIVEPVVSALTAGIPTVEINPGVTDLSRAVAVHLRARAAPALEAIWAQLNSP